MDGSPYHVISVVASLTGSINRVRDCHEANLVGRKDTVLGDVGENVGYICAGQDQRSNNSGIWMHPSPPSGPSRRIIYNLQYSGAGAIVDVLPGYPWFNPPVAYHQI